MRERVVRSARATIKHTNPFIGKMNPSFWETLSDEIRHRKGEFSEHTRNLSKMKTDRVKATITRDAKNLPNEIATLKNRAKKVLQSLWANAKSAEHHKLAIAEQYVRILGQEHALEARLRFGNLVKANNYNVEGTFILLVRNKGNFKPAERLLGVTWPPTL